MHRHHYKSSPENSLESIDVGEKAFIDTINAGERLKQRLALLGISEGVLLRVISNHGPITININHTTVTIGRGMARHIQIKRIDRQ